MGGEGEGGGLQDGHYPHLHLSLYTGAGIFLMSRDTPPLAEGQLGFPLERREIVASLGKEKAGSTWEVLFTIVSALGMARTAFRKGRIPQYL